VKIIINIKENMFAFGPFDGTFNSSDYIVSDGMIVIQRTAWREWSNPEKCHIRICSVKANIQT
jgi:hypothetical protein